MFNFICRTFPNIRANNVRTSPLHKLLYIHHHPLSSSPSPTVKSISSEHSFTISYLINSCGFTQEKALAASKYTNFENPARADSVLVFFKKHGFTQTQISNLVKKFPPVLLCDPDKTLLPKIKFFKSIGLSNEELTKILTGVPYILKRSLDKQIIPTFNFFKSLVQSNEKAIQAIKRFATLLGYDLQTHVAPNIETLKQFGVPESNIMFLLTYQPRAFLVDPDKFRKTVDEVKEMGFDPMRMKFALAIHALRAMTKPTWEKKVEAYKKWGWSEDEILIAFGKHPWCMMVSEDKILGIMEFLVNKMGWESSVLAKRPGLMSLSLSKRIIPRCSVYEVMLSKGLIKKKYSLVRLLECPEKQFVNNISKSYAEEAPELLKLYQEKLDLSK